MNETMLRQRAQTLKGEVHAKTADLEAGRVTPAQFKSFVDNAVEEGAEIERTLKAFSNGAQFMAAQDAALEHLSNGGTPESYSPSTKATNKHSATLKQFGIPQQWWNNEPVSPMSLTAAQTEALRQAHLNSTPFAVTLGQSTGLEQVWGGTQTECVGGPLVSEATLGGSYAAGQIPPIQTQFAVGLGYGPTRASNLFPGYAAPETASITWTTHASNANPAAGTAEGGVFPNLDPVFDVNQLVFQKITAHLPVTQEAAEDTARFGEAAFQQWLPTELTRALVDAESQFVIAGNASSGENGGTAGPTSTFPGILAASGVLTGAVTSGQNPLAALRAGFNTLRVTPGSSGGAYGYPDTILMNPTDWSNVQLATDSQGRFLLDLFAGPAGLTASGQRIERPPSSPNPYAIVPQGSPMFCGNLWGVPVATSTHMPQGTAALMNIAGGAGFRVTRWAVRVEYNMWGADANTNYWTQQAAGWRISERVGLQLTRPAAIYLLTGIPNTPFVA